MRSMWQAWPWMAFVLTALVAHSGRGEKPAATDQADLQGRWAILSLTVGGMPMDFEGEDASLVIEGRKITYPEHKKMQRPAETVWMLIDPTTKPRSVDILPTSVDPDTPQPKGSHTVGIYELEGDFLKMCWVLAGDRPAAFESTQTNSVLVAKRIKKETPDGAGRNPPRPVPPKP